MLTRNNSKSNLKNHEDMHRCLQQKNALIQNLQVQVQDLRGNQQRYDRAYQELTRAKDKLERLVKDTDSLSDHQNSKLEMSNKSLCELRIQIDHLQIELNNRIQNHKDQKFQTQLLLEKSHQKDGQACDVKARAQQLKNCTDILLMENQRSIGQISLMREQLEKQKKDLQHAKKTSDSVCEKIYKTQNYMRNLTREQASSNEQLSRLEDDNNYLDHCLQQMDLVINRNNEDGILIKKQNQVLNFQISTKELDRRKFEKDQKQKSRLLGSEKEKSKGIQQQVKQKQNELARINLHLKDTQVQITEFIKNNSQISDINQQLKEDLEVCLKHLENLQRNNRFLDEQVDRLQEINQNVIRMLQSPNQIKKFNKTASTFGKDSRNTNYAYQN